MKKIPDVLEHGVIYQINLRAFTPEGTLNAAAKMLPHLREIGADIVYLCPVVCADGSADAAGWSDRQRASGFPNPKNPYRIADYANVDPEYGTNEDLHRFVAAAHALGLRVLLDLVYVHCGPGAVFLAEHPDFLLRGAAAHHARLREVFLKSFFHLFPDLRARLSGLICTGHRNTGARGLT